MKTFISKNKESFISASKTLTVALIGGGMSLGVYLNFFAPSINQKYQSNDSFVPTRNIGYVSETTSINSLPDFIQTSEKVTATVVHIRAKVRSKQSELQLMDPFQFFFNDRGRAPFEKDTPPLQEASGSGVIIQENGYIITNHHVIDEAEELEVVLHDQRTFPAKVIGKDPSTDLALIKIEAEGLPVIEVGNSDDVKVGSWVLAVGNPFNLESTVTAGIVSAKGRNLNLIKEKAGIESFIQTDAAINPGNSGGALVDINGKLIGINTAIATPTGVYAGYGFAVPTNLVSKVVKDLLDYGTVQRAFLGVMIRAVDGTLVKEKNLEVNRGVYIDDVQEGSAAQAGGVKKGDVIIAVDAEPTHSVGALQERVARKRPGEKIKLKVQREGEVKDLLVELKNSAGNTDIVKAETNAVLKKLGVTLEPISESLKAKIGGKDGVQVTDLSAGKISEQTKMKEGFILLRINKKAVKSAEDVERIMADSEGGVLWEGVYPDRPNESIFYGFGM